MGRLKQLKTRIWEGRELANALEQQHEEYGGPGNHDQEGKGQAMKGGVESQHWQLAVGLVGRGRKERRPRRQPNLNSS